MNAELFVISCSHTHIILKCLAHPVFLEVILKKNNTYPVVPANILGVRSIH